MRRVYYVLSTHWDREWYQTFQDYRYRLVQLLDRVMAGWERGDLKGPFQTDGQSILLEDYLEVRPERRAQVQQLVSEGKFKVGPWYVLPDEFLVSGESIVRNLRLGRAMARQLGGSLRGRAFCVICSGTTRRCRRSSPGLACRGRWYGAARTMWIIGCSYGKARTARACRPTALDASATAPSRFRCGRWIWRSQATRRK